MKAVEYEQYGGPEVLHCSDVAKPSPQANEVLARVRAVHVNFGDLIARKFGDVSPRQFNMPLGLWVMAKLAFGIRKPRKRVLGNAFAGVIETVSEGVKRFKPGDAVFGYVGEAMGAYAEYVCVPESGFVALKPKNMSFEESAAVPYGALMALSLLRRANVRKGQRVLVIGASGAIGSAAVQLAKNNFGAAVTGVCGGESVDYVKTLGALEVLDRRTTDFSKSLGEYDLIVDVLGKGQFSQLRSSLKPMGDYLSVSFKAKKLLQMLWTRILGGKRVLCTLALPQPQDLTFICELAERRQLASIVERTFPLEQAAEAHRYAEQGHKRGNVVLVVP